MELVYLWVEEYKNIHKQGFNFSPRFHCEFNDEYDDEGNLKDNCKLIICDREDTDCEDKEECRVFCGESMFAHKSDASKSAYAILVKHLKEWGYEFIDCQVPTEHLKSLGAKEVSRDYFLERLNSVNFEYVDNKWYIDEDLIK